MLSTSEMSEIQHHRDDHGINYRRQANANHEHHIPFEVAIKREGHLNKEIDDEHLNRQSIGVLGLQDPYQLREHCPHISYPD